MIRRHRKSGDDDYEADAVDNARNMLYVLVLAACIVWLGPLALGIDGGVKDCADLSELEPFELCVTPDGKTYRVNGDATDAGPVDADEENLADAIMGAAADAEAVLVAVLDVTKYALLVAVAASITVMRVSINPHSPANSRRAVRP